MLAPALANFDLVTVIEKTVTTHLCRPDITIAVRQGATRCLVHAGYSPIWEFSLANSRRADICGLSQKGELVIVEVKSGLHDYKSDSKWRDYAPFCDLFYFAVPPDFPLNLIPSEGDNAPGLIVADAFGAEIIRPAPRFDLSAPRRKAVTLSFARQAAMRALRV